MEEEGVQPNSDRMERGPTMAHVLDELARAGREELITNCEFYLSYGRSRESERSATTDFSESMFRTEEGGRRRDIGDNVWKEQERGRGGEERRRKRGAE
eukprot:760597-Hanusia_phi.AAC.2